METNPWYIYECVPLLKNLAGFEDGSKKNNILKVTYYWDKCYERGALGAQRVNCCYGQTGERMDILIKLLGDIKITWLFKIILVIMT